MIADLQFAEKQEYILFAKHDGVELTTLLYEVEDGGFKKLS